MVHLSLTASSVLVPLAYAVLFVLLLAPGYLAARGIVRRYGFDRAATLPIAYAVTAVAGYAVFWCYFFKPELGRAVSTAWIASAIVAIVSMRRARISREEAVPIALTFLAGLFYLAVLYLPGTTIDAAQRFFVVRPQDNIVPRLFAEHLFQGVNLRDHFLGDWQTSDRPPLQTAILLLVRPVFGWLAIDPNTGYEIGGAVAQLAWLPAAWLLCARAGFSPRQRAFVLAFMVFSGFFLYNTVYTWPKLLAAGMSITALVFAVTPSPRRPANIVLAGVFAALALLAHGGAVFFLVPAFVLAMALRRIALSPALAWGAVAGVVLLLPWSAYQRFYEPPGDWLLKIHLAGIPNVDPRPAGVAIRQVYSETPPGVILHNKLANVETAVGVAPLLASATDGEPLGAVSLWRLREREHVPAALGVLNLGWLVLPWWFARSGDRNARKAGGALLAIALASTLFWCLVMWGPGMTTTTHSAYALESILFVALAAAVAALPLRFASVVLALAVVDLVVTWVAGSLGDAWRVSPSLDPVMALIALATAAAMAAVLALDARTNEPWQGTIDAHDRNVHAIDRRAVEPAPDAPGER